MFTKSFEKTAALPLTWAAMPIAFDAIYTGQQADGDAKDKTKATLKAGAGTLAGALSGGAIGGLAGALTGLMLARKGKLSPKKAEELIRNASSLGIEAGGSIGGVFGAHRGYEWALED